MGKNSKTAIAPWPKNKANGVRRDAQQKWSQANRQHSKHAPPSDVFLTQWQSPRQSWSSAPACSEEALSRLLSSILRHNAASLGLYVRPDGYVKIADLLELDQFASKGVDEATIVHLVDINEKNRYGLKRIDQELHVRAHQGHSMTEVEDESLLNTVESADELPFLCHGTFEKLWPEIREEGLKPMKRNHIHCVAKDLTSEEHRNVIISGTRGECDVVIFINAEEAMAEGITFQWSDNDVVLTRGKNNKIPPRFFKAVHRWNWEDEKWEVMPQLVFRKNSTVYQRSGSAYQGGH